ncbi:MAG TPA: hypothetical protein VFG39_02335 [Balneolaceae bacterium]|nr:hypothetical protein [Balneolaceae bacterium]
MNQLKFSGLFLLTLLLLTSCSSVPNGPWPDAVPQKVPFVIIPAENATLSSVLESPYAPFLDDITSSATQLLSRIDSTAPSPLNLKSIMLYPGTTTRLQAVWMARAPAGFIELLKNTFYEDFTQNQYFFHDVVIHKLHLQNRYLFAAQLHDLLLISESSLGIEDAIRAYRGELPRLNFEKMPPKPGHIVLNTPSLDRWVQQLAKVSYHPVIQYSMKGTKPALLTLNREGEQQSREFQFTGTIALSDSIPSNLVAAFSGSNAPITLDRYISSNAAGFGIFRREPRMAPPTSVPDTTKLDAFLMNNKVQYADIANTLDKEFALVLYAESGFLSTGEHLFMRKVSDESTLRNELANLADNGLIERSDGTYYIQSGVLSELIGSSLCSFQNFYLDITGDVVVISERKGLAEIVSSDHNRRRTVYYEEEFRDIKQGLSNQLSGLFFLNSEFYSFIKPFLAPENYVNAFTSKFDLLAIATRLSEDGSSLSFTLNTYQTEEQDAPYREKWIFPTGAGLSGEPVLADIGGSSRDEVIFATKSGHLYALAADGTVVMQANTGSDEPVGSPVVFDWYATNQNVILLAAGNKIYGWDDNGQPLPKFPFEMNEAITAPLVVADVNRDGLPNALVATANRNLHVLNGRGQNLIGWPVTANAVITTKPVVENYMGSVSVLAFSQNAVHAWNQNGRPKQGFPKFISSSLNGSPIVYDEHILANAADGYLYSIGSEKMFADSLNVFEITSDSSNIEAVYTSNSPLVGTPAVQQLPAYGQPVILTVSSNGSVFLLDTSGQLRFTENMGQPAAPHFSPYVADIDKNGQNEIIALADYGRLYAWKVGDGERIYSVPTSSMEYPIVADIDNDGWNELIAQTNEGVRCWTIYGE